MNPILVALEAQVAKTRTVAGSATVCINGINQRIADAIAAALKNGATEAELAPFADLTVALTADVDALAAAVTANTPAGP